MREMLRPPLPARLRPAHWIVLDTVVAAAYAGLFAGWVLPRVLRGHGQPVAGLPVWLDWVAVALVTVPVSARRRFPRAALGMAIAGTVLATMGALRQAPFPALAYVLGWVALTRSRRDAAAALIAAEAGVIVAYAVGSTLTSVSPAGSAAALPSLLLTVLTQAAAWLIGRTLAQQRAYRRGLAEQAARQAQAEISAARAAVTAQRLQIARDLHDVVAHSVSLMTVQAGAARILADTRPGETRQLLAAIEATGRDCLRETRRVLGVLRDDQPVAGAPPVPGDGAAARLPAPSLGELTGLVTRSAAAGVTVAIRTQGTPRGLPATVDLAAYRIIQEALTNVVRHSTADRCQVTVSYGAHALSIEVSNPPSGPRSPLPSPPGAGQGLIGMRERAALHGGRFSAGPVPGGDFAVTATLLLLEATA